MIIRITLIVGILLVIYYLYNIKEREKFNVILDNNEEKKMNKMNYENKLKMENKDLKYYYNDIKKQDNIKEKAEDIINNIDKIDYSKIRTGYEKCKKECDGLCFNMGYTGNATCYPKY